MDLSDWHSKFKCANRQAVQCIDYGFFDLSHLFLQHTHTQTRACKHATNCRCVCGSSTSVELDIMRAMVQRCVVDFRYCFPVRFGVICCVRWTRCERYCLSLAHSSQPVVRFSSPIREHFTGACSIFYCCLNIFEIFFVKVVAIPCGWFVIWTFGMCICLRSNCMSSCQRTATKTKTANYELWIRWCCSFQLIYSFRCFLLFSPVSKLKIYQLSQFNCVLSDLFSWNHFH